MMRLMVGLSLLAAPAMGQEPAIPRFADVTASAGIDSVFWGEWEYMVGGGVAVFDCDGNRKPDMVLAGGTAPAKFYRNTGEVGGALSFAQEASGLEMEAVTGAYPLDIDSDGIMDVVLLRVGENQVMRGLGDCRFESANTDWGFDGGDGWSTAFAATWEAGQSWPTIAIGNYVDRYETMMPWGSCTDNWLHRPDFTDDRFGGPIPLTPSYCALSMLFTDWNRSGTPSLRVSNDREYYKGGQEQLWRIQAGLAPELYGPEDGWQRLRIWGMGIAGHDLNADGYPEYFLTSMADNKLQVLSEIPEAGAPLPVYSDLAYARGVTAHRPYTGGEIKPSTAWHAQFEDVNNDGLADLFVAKGNVWEMPDFALLDPNNLLLQRSDGTFLEAGEEAGVASLLTARGAVLADFNLDGQLDLLVVNRHDKAQLWQNVSDTSGNWLAVAPHQSGANRDAIGGWIEVRTGDLVQRREITSGGGHVSGIAGFSHFGLGDAQSADIRMLWPDGTEGEWQAAQAGGFYNLERDAPLARWHPDAN
ncbi:CRTAC1 family protein [Pelagibacterium flavum]|uniref:CRTAC1 family protein n=1 Tax=Pelagibacterium flavum TaxID=2984530 RepID=A0ABY6IRL6_9HYPH|nr:CRTAC1 family protein [Pelagibacterium sp. YIM 151497]UYQ72084.1 CRTAC1 family protein [Pelagibacterium sp. YIM 151497]